MARVVAEGQSLDVSLGALSLGERDLKLARTLANGALRWHHRLDWQLRQLLNQPLPKQEAVLSALLRVGLFQLQFTRVPEHAAVSTTVAASRLIGRAGHAKLVNALQRRFLREREGLAQRMEQAPEAVYAHPRWLLERLRHDWPERWREVVAASNELPPLWLRVNLRRGSRAEYLERLTAAGIEAESSDAVAERGAAAAPAAC